MKMIAKCRIAGAGGALGLLLLLSFPCVALAGDENEFSDGVFIVNEDWYGHQNSTVNWLSSDGEWSYRAFQGANADDGLQLGCTNQYGAIYGNRFYFIAKQERDPGAGVTGGRITVADARTLKMLYQSAQIDPSGAQCDGRGYLGVDAHKGYISSSNGIWVFDTDTYQVTGQVEGSANPNVADGRPATDPGSSLYHGQCGSMVRVADRVFAAHQQYGLLVIDPECDKVVDIIGMQPVYDILPSVDGGEKVMPGIGSVVLALDGSLWVSVAADVQGSGATLPYLMRVDPESLECRVVEVPEGFYPPANSWYAWTPDGFCASAQRNVLYWNGGPNSWFSTARVYSYDIDSGEFKIIVNLDREAVDEGLTQYTRWNIYGASMRVHPATDELYMSLYHYFQNPTYRLRRTDSDGTILAEYDMIQNYWFPSLPVFPDNYLPEAADMMVDNVSEEEPLKIDLSGWASDPDNLDSGIVYSIAGVSDSEMIEAAMDWNTLVVTPLEGLRNGESNNEWVDILINSNGETISRRVTLAYSSAGVINPEAIAQPTLSIAEGLLTIVGGNGQTLDILTMDGKLIASRSLSSDKEMLGIATLPGGIYIARVGSRTLKFVN